MIADSQTQNVNANVNATLDSQPPAYELLTGSSVSDASDYPKDVKHPLPPQQHQQPKATPMPAIYGTPLIDLPTTAGSSATGVTVYHYVHPVTQQHVTSLLPPDHPEMICLQQGHERRSSFGLVGILAAIFWFPLGMACMLIDRKVRCKRCGATLESAICD